MKSLSSMVVAVAVVSVIGCGSSLAPDQTVVLGVSKLDAPTAVSGGQSINLVLSVMLGGCLSFDRIEIQRDAAGANITAWGKDASIGRRGVYCTSDLRIEAHPVELQPPFQNPYTVQVNRGRIGPFVVTVQVN